MLDKTDLDITNSNNRSQFFHIKNKHQDVDLSTTKKVGMIVCMTYGLVKMQGLLTKSRCCVRWLIDYDL